MPLNSIPTRPTNKILLLTFLQTLALLSIRLAHGGSNERLHLGHVSHQFREDAHNLLLSHEHSVPILGHRSGISNIVQRSSTGQGIVRPSTVVQCQQVLVRWRHRFQAGSATPRTSRSNRSIHGSGKNQITVIIILSIKFLLFLYLMYSLILMECASSGLNKFAWFDPCMCTAAA